jgi:co-chaperonin GroES (HSP10)
MKVLSKYLLVRPVEDEQVTDSGLILSYVESENNIRYRKAVVYRSGEEVASVSDEDEIYFDKNAGFTIMIGPESYHVILERDVVLVL